MENPSTIYLSLDSAFKLSHRQGLFGTAQGQVAPLCDTPSLPKPMDAPMPLIYSIPDESAELPASVQQGEHC